MTFLKDEIFTPKQLTLFILFFIGAYLRINGVSELPFSVDEYYLTKSTLSILQNGFPDFIYNGYYTRGLLQQYISAVFILIFDDLKFSMRLLPILAGLATALGTYKVTKLTTRPEIAFLGAIIILFSLWEVELSRFARMYAIHQAIFIWQVYFLIKALYFSEPNKFKYVVLLALVASFTTEGAVFSVFICALPLLISPKVIRPIDILLFSTATCIALLFIFIDWRHLGAHKWLPNDIDLALITAKQSTKIDLPPLNILATGLTPSTIILLIGIMVFSFFITLRFLETRNRNWNLIFIALIIILPILKLPGLSIILATALWLICFFHYEKYKNFKAALYLVAHAIFWCVIWLAFELATNSNTYIKEILRELLKYPNFWDKWLYIWQWYIPTTTNLIIVGCSLSVATYFFIDSSCSRALRFLICLLILTLVLFGLINTHYTASRYTYFLYPLFIIGAISGVYGLLLCTKLGRRSIVIGTYLITLIAFAFSNDFNLKHLININTYEFVYRTHYPEKKRAHYKIRFDTRAAADFIKNNVETCKQVISVTPQTDFYIPEYEYFYIPEDSSELLAVSANEGKNFIWSGQKLIYKERDLKEKLSSRENTPCLIIHKNQLFNWMEPMIAYQTPDSQLFVVTNVRN